MRSKIEQTPKYMVIWIKIIYYYFILNIRKFILKKYI